MYPCQVEIRPSARKRGIADEDIVHALRNAFRTVPGDGFEMLIGADTTGRLLEVGVRVDDDDELIVFHAMPARPKFLR
jgi:hypothetical protein